VCRQAAQAPPSFLLPRSELRNVEQFYRSVYTLDPEAKVSATIDLTGLYKTQEQVRAKQLHHAWLAWWLQLSACASSSPAQSFWQQTRSARVWLTRTRVPMQLDINIWRSREWLCAKSTQPAWCNRQASIVAPGSPFVSAVSTWLRRGEARFEFRNAGLVDCASGSSNNSYAQGVCSNATANCVFGGKYCIADPHGGGGSSDGGGREVLIESMRMSCATRVRL
jgi:hypothetical protein